MTTISGDMTAAAPASREQHDHFRVLYESALVFGGSHEMDAVLALVCGQVRSALRADLAVIWMDAGDGLRCRATAGPVGGPAVGDMRTDAATDDVGVADAEPDARGLSEQLASPGRVFGMVEVVAGTAREPFTAADRALLRDLAPLAAASLADAEARHADSRAADLTLLLEISREITATLDLDRVLRSVVNLSARALSFDRAAVALYDKGICDIRAVAGQQTINPKDPKVLDLAARAAWVAGHGESFYMVDREDPASDAERQMVQIFGQDLEADDARSGLYLPLKDEEGTVGILLFEASRPEFA
ncbi:MAG: GAF domain-containing protein, partial [Gemmatimonadota bacterium]